MKIKIHHSLPGRIRVRYDLDTVFPRQALLTQTLIAVQDGITDISVNTTVGSFLILYDEEKLSEKQIVSLFLALTEKYLEDDSLLNAVAEVPVMESIFGVFIQTFIIYFAKKLLPLPLRTILLVKDLVPRVCSALQRISEGTVFSTELLDAAALTAALATGNRDTASSISTLLSMGEDIELITRRQSYGNLSRTLLAGSDEVRIIDGDEERTVPLNAVRPGDLLVVRQNSLIPADGTVEKGEGLVNQAGITGEPLPVEKQPLSTVFAGTLLAEGELYVRVVSSGKNTKVQNIIDMIDSSQNLKASAQKRSEMVAEKIVPFNFLLTALTYFFTRNITRTLSTLMVDYSCAMKLAAPISVLSAMKEAADYGISVKGGKYLEEAAFADIAVFDKTGTLTFAEPVLSEVYALNGFSKDEVLKWAACLEEHYPHPLGRAVVKAAENLGLKHPEEHTKVDYIVAHGIASSYGGKKIRVGSAHFIFDDEKIPVTEEVKKIRSTASDSGDSLLYLAYDGKLAGIIAVGDPVRPQAGQIIQELHSAGISKCIMITGDTENAAKKIAEEAGLDEYIAQALPEDKVRFIEKQKSAGHKVIMLGDGINDAPALSAADVGVAVDGCSSIAGDTADIELTKNGLENLVVVRKLGSGLIQKINENNASIICVNSALLLCGIFGLISPQVAAVLHNSMTVAMCMQAMKPVLEEKQEFL
ncbi:heavy metal translocating P-type ATPase [Treponema sp.]|uniref:heavy metal translocating P-type ATPase n=1 Tax=Treponema sp. TaxID=166 RepID=UPI003F00A64F